MAKAKKAPVKRWDRIEQYAQTNLECADIILQNPERYGGAEALPVIWARMILTNEQRVKTLAAWRLVA